MKRTQLSEKQIIDILKEAEAGAVATDLCRRHGMSSATYYAWKAKFGGLEVSDAKRPSGTGRGERAPEAAAGRHDARQCGSEGPAFKKMGTPAAGPKAARNAYREAAAHLQTTLGMNERRACAVVGAASPSTARRRSGSIARK